jgi:UDP-glucose 4-epimerase
MPAIADGKFVILGGASQVGCGIAEQLLAAGAREVVLVDNLSLGSTDTVQPLLEDRRCTFVRADVLRLNELFDPLKSADGVFMVAAYMATSIGQDPWAGLDVNIRGLQNALEACRYQAVKKIVISSSAGVYGALHDEPTDEESPLRWHALPPGRVLYGASKIAGEGLARLYHQRHGIDFVALRYTAVYGERQHGRALVGGHMAETCRRLRRGEPPIVEGDGRQEQDYIYAGDVARANLMAMASAVTAESINICSGANTSQRRIVEIASRACASRLEPQYREAPSGAKTPVASRPAISREKAKRLLGWEPEVSIEEGVAKVLRWVDQQLAAQA